MREIANILKDFREKKVLLLAHHNADLDAIASALTLQSALKKLDFKVRIGVVDSVSKLSKEFLEKFNKKIEINPSLDDVDLIILLDTSTRGQLSDFAEKFEQSKTKKILIDHHTLQENGLKSDYKFVDEKASSTTELVYDLIKELGLQPSKEDALIISAGLVAETAHLKFANLKVFEILTNLIKQFNIKFDEVLDILSSEVDVSEKIARFKAAKRLKLHRIQDYLIVTSNITSFEASVARSLIKMGADLVAVYAKRDKEIRVSLRAKSHFVKKTNIDLGKNLIPEVAKIINGTGSGHPTAAGANGLNLKAGEKALNFVVSYVKRNQNED